MVKWLSCYLYTTFILTRIVDSLNYKLRLESLKKKTTNGTDPRFMFDKCKQHQFCTFFMRIYNGWLAVQRMAFMGPITLIKIMWACNVSRYKLSALFIYIMLMIVRHRITCADWCYFLIPIYRINIPRLMILWYHHLVMDSVVVPLEISRTQSNRVWTLILIKSSI